jgi:hypothetical protein
MKTTALLERNGASAKTRAPQAPTSGLEPDALLRGRGDKPESWSERLDDLLDIRCLEDDWDGLGARAPSLALVDSAIQLAQELRQLGCISPSRIVPGVNGTVLFEWQADGVYWEIEVLRPYYAEAVKMTTGEPPEHWIFTA